MYAISSTCHFHTFIHIPFFFYSPHTTCSGISSGKSLVADYIHTQYKIPIIDGDDVARYPCPKRGERREERGERREERGERRGERREERGERREERGERREEREERREKRWNRK
jgi:dephospho-CoA kinase